MGRTLGKAGSLVAALALVTVLSLPANARDMNGKFGLGFDQTLAGVSGISAKYWIGDFGIRGVLGLDFIVPRSGGTRMSMNFALGVIYNFARTEAANLGIGVMADLGYNNGAATGGGSSIQVNVEVPLTAEIFITDHFSFHISVGLAVAIIPSGGSALGDARPKNDSQGNPIADASGNVTSYEGDITATGEAAGDNDKVGIHFGNGSLFGNMGFTYYF
ncbi:MAG: hypothetical protein ISR64_10105 [Deltaproteobacteria bacterium]|nr:hypothetical protein [Deltaproteobacteria bacterium]